MSDGSNANLMFHKSPTLDDTFNRGPNPIQLEQSSQITRRQQPKVTHSRNLFVPQNTRRFDHQRRIDNSAMLEQHGASRRNHQRQRRFNKQMSRQTSVQPHKSSVQPQKLSSPVQLEESAQVHTGNQMQTEAKAREFKLFTKMGIAFLSKFVDEHKTNDNTLNGPNDVPTIDRSSPNIHKREARQRIRHPFLPRRTQGRRFNGVRNNPGDMVALEVESKVLNKEKNPPTAILNLEPVTVEVELESQTHATNKAEQKVQNKESMKAQQGAYLEHLMTIPSFSSESSKNHEKQTNKQVTRDDLKRLSNNGINKQGEHFKPLIGNDNDESLLSQHEEVRQPRFRDDTKGLNHEPFRHSLDVYLTHVAKNDKNQQHNKINKDKDAVLAEVDARRKRFENRLHDGRDHTPRRVQYQRAKEMFKKQQQQHLNNKQVVAPEFAEVDAKTTASTRARVGIFSSISNFVKKLMRGGKAAGAKNNPQAIEDCVGCRFVWGMVEMDVGNARYIEDIQASFEHNCMDAQKSTIFYAVCEDMYDDMYAMTDDYMSNKFNTKKMCQRGQFCTK